MCPAASAKGAVLARLIQKSILKDGADLLHWCGTEPAAGQDGE